MGKTKILNNKGVLLLFLPGLIWFIVFKYLPLIGIATAFTDYGRTANVSFIGFDNFVRLFQSPNFIRAFKNTLIISVMNLMIYFPIPILLALLINEVKSKRFVKLTQFITYVPHFFSWVVVGSIFVLMLSPSSGIINKLLVSFGVEKPIFFMASNDWFRSVIVSSHIWKDAGYGAVIFIAALAGIDPQLYEAAVIDGASHFQKVLFITLPGIKSTIATVLFLEVAKVLNIFEQIFIMYNPAVYESGDVLKTYIYRAGLSMGDISYATAVGLFTSIISAVLLIGCNHLSKKLLGEKVI